MTSQEEHDNAAPGLPPANHSNEEAKKLRPRRQDFDTLSDEELERERALCVELMYRYYLGRGADADGLRGHIGSLCNGMTLLALARAIENSPEAMDRRQRRRDFDALSDGEFVVALAEFLFQGRGALPEEVEQWKNVLADDRARRIEVIKGAMETVLANKRGGAQFQNDPAYCWIMGTDRWIVPGAWENKARELSLSAPAVPHSGLKTKPQPFRHSGEYAVSAIASLYKGSRHIEQFLENITTQTIFDRSELIIIDADSPEGEEQTIAEYQKNFQNIVYKRINYRLGVYDAWNVGVEMSRGRYLTNTNLDDLRRRDSFELQAATLDRYDFIDVVYQDFFYNLDDSLSFEEIEKFGFKSDLPIITPHNLLKFNSPHNGPMWRKSLHAELGLFDASYKSAGDWEFWMRCLSNGKNFLKINTPHVAYFQNPQGISTRPDTRGLEEGRRILRHYSDKLISSELRLSREGLAEALGTQADWDATTSHYDVVQRELNRLGARFRGKIETTDST
jgi:glycosyltransferase involved in cell wall biosynthesis